MVRAHILSGDNFSQWRSRFKSGEVPSELPYGIDHLERLGWTLTSRHHSQGRLATRARDFVEHRSGMIVERTVRAVPAVARADVVLALLERDGYLASLWKGLGAPPFRSRPLVIWSCWLAEDIRRAEPERREWFRRRIAAADLITHMSPHEAETFVDLGIPAQRLTPVDFGVSHRWYTPTDGPRDIQLLAVGQDRGRDYATLLEAIRGSDLTLDLVCRPENLAGLDLPANVRLHGMVPMTAYRDLLRRAQIVAVPTFDLAYPTGQSVALEAASSGCAVAVTGTTAMRDYFDDGVNAELVEVGDAARWRTTLTELACDQGRRDALGTAARHHVVERFNADRMWSGLVHVMTKRGLC